MISLKSFVRFINGLLEREIEEKTKQKSYCAFISTLAKKKKFLTCIISPFYLACILTSDLADLIHK